jgi:P-type E1-E2 ATPase
MLHLSSSLEDGSYNPLEMAAALEAKSSHPLANAIVSSFTGCIAEAAGEFLTVRKLTVVEGLGLEGWVEVEDDWKHVFVGNEKLLIQNGGKIRLSDQDNNKYNDFCSNSCGAVIVLIVIDDELELLLALSDKVRAESSDAVTLLHDNLGLDVHMITGDHQDVALQVCKQVGISIDNCRSRLLPTEKLSWIKNQQTESNYVVMIGDGINDAAALAASTVGVAMGVGGSAMAAAAADVVMMSDNLLKLPATIQLCRQSRNVIIQNCAFSIGFKIIGVVLAVMGKNLFVYK